MTEHNPKRVTVAALIAELQKLDQDASINIQFNLFDTDRQTTFFHAFGRIAHIQRTNIEGRIIYSLTCGGHFSGILQDIIID